MKRRSYWPRSIGRWQLPEYFIAHRRMGREPSFPLILWLYATIPRAAVLIERSLVDGDPGFPVAAKYVAVVVVELALRLKRLAQTFLRDEPASSRLRIAIPQISAICRALNSSKS